MAEFFIKKVTNLNDLNNVNIIKLNGYQLPPDTQYDLSADKMINQSQILDGVVVYERVTRKPWEITFNFVLREFESTQPVLNTPLGTINFTPVKWIFPLKLTQEIVQQVFNVDSVLKVENIYLNRIGIQQVIVSEIGIGVNRGTVNVPVRLRCFEDAYTLGNTNKSTLNT